MFAHPFLSIKQLHVKKLDLDSCQILHVFGLMYCCSTGCSFGFGRCNPSGSTATEQNPGVMISLLKPSMNIGCR